MEQNAIGENYILDQLLMQSGLIVPYSKDYILLLKKDVEILLMKN